MTTEKATVTLPITLQSQTRQITFDIMSTDDTRAYNISDFKAQIGRGSKTHKTFASAHKFSSVEEARRRNYSPRNIFTLENGEVWGFNHTCVVLNKQGQICGFNDADTTSQHSNGMH